jgi:endonuclease/exonuclease/phosphatase family metal-dependent hydrolase
MAQGLGAITARRAPAAPRFADPHVIAACAAADVLCVQELLSDDAQRFFDALGRTRFGSSLRDDNRVSWSGVTVRGSGLGICTRAALEQPRVHSFPGAGVSWDRLARKGALHARVALDSATVVDVVTTHLQAGHDAAAMRVRAAQLSDLTLLVTSIGSSARPFIVCGDFNIDGLGQARGGAEYPRLAAALPGFEDLGAAEDCPTFDPRPDGNSLAYRFSPDRHAQRLDYVFWRPAPGGGAGRCTELRRIFDRPLATTGRGGRAQWASDHCGLTATFELDARG